MEKAKSAVSPASKLNDMMIRKVKLCPIYEIIFAESNRGVAQFVMRVSSPISLGGPPYAAYSDYCRSKKEAKQNAALVFMQAFLNHGTDVQSTTVQTNRPKSAADAGTDMLCSIDVLKVVCSKNNLEKPEIKYIGIESSSNAVTHVAECMVSNLCIKGRGKSKVEAIRHAVANTIQILTRPASIHEILKSPILPTSEGLMSALKAVRLSINPKGSQLPAQNVVHGERKIDAASEKPKEIRRACSKTDTAKTLPQLMSAREKAAGKIINSNNNSAENEDPISFAEDSQPERFVTKPNSTTINNNTKMDCVQKPKEMRRACRKTDTAKTLPQLISAREKAAGKSINSNNNSAENEDLINCAEDSQQKRFVTKPNSTTINDTNNTKMDCVNRGVLNIRSSKFDNNLTRLQAVSQIDRTLGKFEKQLYNKILNALMYSGLANQQTVTILSHDYQVLINEGSFPRIFQGNNECNDQGIKLACLTKLLLDLKGHIEIYHRRSLRIGNNNE